MIKRESIRKGIFSTSALNIVGRGIGFLSVFLVSYLFGANSHTDIFYFLLAFTALVTTLFTGLYSSVFLPLFIKIREQESNEKAWLFLNALFTYTLLFAIFIGSVYYIWAIKIVARFSNFSEAALLLSRDILIFFAPVIVLMILVEFLKTVIQSQYQFTLPALSVLFNSVINVLLLFVLGKLLGVRVMAISIIISYLIQFIFLFRYIKKNEPLFSLGLKWSNHHSQFLKLGMPVIITQLFSIISMFYYDYSATIFTAGTLTSMALAQKIFSLPQDMIISPLSNVVAPVFSEDSANGNFRKFNDNLVRYNNIIWLMIIPLSFFFILYSYPITQILFLRGEFTADNAQVSSITLQLLATGLFGYSFHAIATRALFARQKTFWLSTASLIISLVSVGITYFLANRLGYPGISLARSVSVGILSVGTSVILLKCYVPEFKLVKLAMPLLKMITGAVAASLLSYAVFKAVDPVHFSKSSFVNIALTFCFVSPVFLFAYCYVCYLLRVTEFLEIFSFIKNKKRLNQLKFLRT